MAVQYSSFAGWATNLKLFNDSVEVLITLQVGPADHFVPATGRRTAFTRDGAIQKATARISRVWEMYCPEGTEEFSLGFQTRFQTLIIIHSLSAGKRSPSATIDCLEKYRSPVRTKYRLEANATLRRRVVAVGSRR
jgi:hypothetical protein